MVEHVLAGQAVHHPRARHVQPARAPVAVGLVLSHPGDLGPDRLAGQHGATDVEDPVRTEQVVECVDLPGGSGVDAVQDGRAHGSVIVVHQQGARSHAADADRGDVVVPTICQLLGDLDELTPPEVAVHLDLAYHGTRDRVRTHHGADDLPVGPNEDTLAARGPDIDSEEGARHASTVPEIDYRINLLNLSLIH